MEITVKVCDLCGFSVKSNVARHWTVYVGHGIVSFKNVAGSQEVPLDGDVCMTCAHKIAEAVRVEIEKIKPTGKENHERPQQGKIPEVVFR